jgi:hypothetical protein
MNAFWAYFWPICALGIALGLVGGLIGFRRRRSWIFVAAAVLALAGAGLWHGPMGAAGALSASIERDAHDTLTYYEMTQVQVRLHRDPLTRRLQLSGPANAFQRSELARLIEDIPGVSSARWSNSAGLPLIVEAAVASVLGFLVGLLLAYVIELRRRHNAQWKW